MGRTWRYAAATWGVVASLLVGGCGFAAVPASQTPVARVNGQVITRGEWDKEVRLLQLLNPTSAPSIDTPQARQRILTLLEDDVLLEQVARKHHLSAPAEVVKATEAQIVSVIQNQLYGSASAYAQALHRLSLSPNDVRRFIATSLLVDTVLNHEVRVPAPSTQELLSYYKSHRQQFTVPELVHVRHILVKSLPEAERILSLLRHGARFSVLARKYSQDPGSASRGGDLGWIDPSTMVAPFAKAVLHLKPDQTSGIVHSPYGYHIIQVLGIHPATVQPFSQVKGAILSQILRARTESARASYLENLRRHAKIREYVAGSGA